MYQRQDGRWCAQITVRRDDGTRGRKTLYGRTQREVKAKMVAAQRAAQCGVISTMRPPTVAQYGQTWLAGKRQQMELGHLAETTLRSYEDNFRLHIEPHLGGYRLENLTKTVLSEFLIARQQHVSHRGRPLAARTVGYIHSLVRNMLNEAVRDGWLHSNPMGRVRAPRQQRPRIQPPTLDEVAALFAATEGDRLQALLLVLFATGLRIGECTALTWADIDLDRRLVSVTKTGGRVPGERDAITGRRSSRHTERTTKTPGSEAEIAISPIVAEVLSAHRETQTRERLAGKRWADNDLVFTTPVGTVLDHRNLRRTFDDACRRAGLERHLRLHDLRHGTAGALIAEGMDAAVVMGALRHTRISTTIDIYGALLVETKHTAAAAMDARIRRALAYGNDAPAHDSDPSSHVAG